MNQNDTKKNYNTSLLDEVDSIAPGWDCGGGDVGRLNDVGWSYVETYILEFI